MYINKIMLSEKMLLKNYRMETCPLKCLCANINFYVFELVFAANEGISNERTL